MHKLDQQKFPLPSCPSCKRSLNATMYDVYTKRIIKCSSCGSELRFDSSSANSLRSSIAEIAQWERRVEEANKGLKSSMEKFKNSVEDTMNSMEVLIKRK